MTALSLGLLAAACLLAGCAGPGYSQGGPPTGHIGVPAERVDSSMVGQDGPAPAPKPVDLPERIVLPASYRLMLLDGHMALVRETDARSLESAPASMRIIAGEISRGELAYQPALLPQELAAEVAANRESAARMDNALESVMQRSRELSEQAGAVQAQSRKLADLLAEAESKLRDAGSASGTKAARESSEKTEADDPRE
jgi:hypothetical protein